MYIDKSQKCGIYLSERGLSVPLGFCNIFDIKGVNEHGKIFCEKSANFICFYLKNILLSQRKHLTIVS